MRVLILHSRYLSGPVSGENRVVEDESRLLREAGHEVLVWEPEPDDQSGLAQLRMGVSAVWSASAAARVRSLVRRDGIQIVHAHNLFPTLSPAVLRTARDEGAAVVVTLHNYRLLCLSANLLRDGQLCEDCLGHVPWRGVQHACYRNSTLGSTVLAGALALHRGVGTFDAVTRYLAVSEFVRRQHVDARALRPEKVAVKRNFSWPALKRTGPGDHFVVAGRLTREKGIDTLLEAWKHGVARRLLVVGDGPDAAGLRAAAPDGVEFLGPVSGGRVAEIVASARALLVPSRWYEAAGKTVLEAYAAGVPVVASDIGALPEAVEDSVSGYLVPPLDVEAWGEALGRLESDTESERLGRGAGELWARHYSPERGLDALEAAYRDAMAVRG